MRAYLVLVAVSTVSFIANEAGAMAGRDIHSMNGG